MSVDALLFILLASLWGGSFVAIKFAVAAFPPAFCAMLRAGISLAVLVALFKTQRRDLRVPAALRRKMWLTGLFAQGFPFVLLFWGERRVSPGLAGIINGTVPIWTFVLGLLTGGESFTRRRTAGLVVGFLGIATICAPLLRFGGTGSELAGVGAVFLMAISYGAGTRLTRALLSGAGVDFRANSFHQNCASAAFLAAFSLATDPWPSARAFFGAPAPLAAVAYLGVLSTALAFLIYFHLIREWGAVRAAAVTYCVPVLGLFWDYVFFRNVPYPSEIVGAMAVLGGVALLHAPAARPKPRSAAQPVAA